MGKQLPDGKNLEQESSHTCDEVKKIVEHLFDACRKFDEVYPKVIHKQRLKRRMMELSSHNKNATVGKQM